VKISHSLYKATCSPVEKRQQRKIPCDGKAKLPNLTSFPIYATSATNNKERIPQMLCLPCVMPINNEARPCVAADPRRSGTPTPFPRNSSGSVSSPRLSLVLTCLDHSCFIQVVDTSRAYTSYKPVKGTIQERRCQERRCVARGAAIGGCRRNRRVFS
jgi:hypothetical protein